MSFGFDATQGVGCDSTCVAGFADQMAQVASEIESRGAIPIMGYLPWHPDPTRQAELTAMNAQIDAVRAADPNIVMGPDLWTVFNQHPEYWDMVSLAPDDVLSDAGKAATRTAWANAALQRGGVYCR
jgi:hypothetical protein